MHAKLKIASRVSLCLVDFFLDVDVIVAFLKISGLFILMNSHSHFTHGVKVVFLTNPEIICCFSVEM